MSDMSSATPQQQLLKAFGVVCEEIPEKIGGLQKLTMEIKEEGLSTDLHLLVEKNAPGVLVPDIPVEHKTGADWIWLMKEASNKLMFVQAKRIDPVTLSYPHLDHTVAGSGARQVDLLIDSAANVDAEVSPDGGWAKAYYVFYNWSPLSSADNGVFTLPASVVRTLVDQSKTRLSDLKGSGYWQPLTALAEVFYPKE